MNDYGLIPVITVGRSLKLLDIKTDPIIKLGGLNEPTIGGKKNG
jgi:hypothetical protein